MSGSARNMSKALTGESINREVDEIMDEYITEIINSYCSDGNTSQDWDWSEYCEEVLQTFSLDIKLENDHVKTKDELREISLEGANSILDYKKEIVNEDIFDQFQKWVVLRTIDEKWREHLAGMDQLREGIGLRAYGQKNPLIEYKQEGFGMFVAMMAETNQETLKRIFRTNIQQEDQKPVVRHPATSRLKMQHDESEGMGFVAPPKSMQTNDQEISTGGQKQVRQPIHTEKKIGRNDPCLCGSGKKFKKCCG